MSDIRSTDPKLLLEAARVFNAAGRDYRGAAEVVAQLALESKDEAEPPVRQAIIGDAAALRLSGRVPGGYRAALALLEPVGDAEADDPDGRLHLLRALANGQRYAQEPAARNQLRKSIIDDLKIALHRNPKVSLGLPHYWQPRPLALAEGGDPEDDLRAVYLDTPGFEALIGLPGVAPSSVAPAGAAGPQGGATGAEGGATGAAAPPR